MTLAGIEPDFSVFAEPHPASNVLKLYLRELPDPLLPFSTYDSFVDAASTVFVVEKCNTCSEARAACVPKLKDLVNLLPRENRFTLQHLILFLTEVQFC